MIPIKWKPSRMVTGISKRTGAPVEKGSRHILLLEDWNGRVQGDFLCGARITNRRAHEELVMTGWHKSTGPVTCKRCIKAAERMKRKNGAA
jgi:hypothetical protein